jgi:hypothetical protein
MPLTAEQNKQICELFKITNPEPHAELGKALRRACKFPPANPSEWPARIDLIINMSAELEAQNPNEIFKKNEEKCSALNYAIHSLLSYAKQTNASNAEIHYRMYVVSAIAAACPESELSAATAFYANYYSKPEYKQNVDFLYSGAMLFGPNSIQKVDLCIEALRFLFDTLNNAKKALEFANATVDLDYDAANTDQEMPQPIIFLHEHDDKGVCELFLRASTKLQQQNYKMLCLELHPDTKPDKFTKDRAESFLGMPLIPTPLSRAKDDVFRFLISVATKNVFMLRFIDMSHLQQPQEMLLSNIYLEAFNMMLFINGPRDKAMVFTARMHSVMQKTGTVIVSGINHYSGLKREFEDLGIKPRFVVVTQDRTKMHITKFEMSQQLETLLKQPDVKFLDLATKPNEDTVLSALGIGTTPRTRLTPQ